MIIKTILFQPFCKLNQIFTYMPKIVFFSFLFFIYIWRKNTSKIKNEILLLIFYIRLGKDHIFSSSPYARKTRTLLVGPDRFLLVG